MLLKNIFHLHGGGHKFFPLFSKQSELIKEASQLLVAILKESSNERKKEIARKIKSIEKEILIKIEMKKSLKITKTLIKIS